jgi:hypothetical protein
MIICGVFEINTEILLNKREYSLKINLTKSKIFSSAFCRKFSENKKVLVLLDFILE